MEILKNFFSTILFDTTTNAIVIFSFVIISGLILFLMRKIEQVGELNLSLNKLRRSFDDLDEQAKLIVKTDLELNKTQEELGKRLTALNALQKTSRLISTTLDADEIFKRLGKSLVVELGFEKSLILMLDNDKNLYCRTESGFKRMDIENIITGLTKDHSLSSIIHEGRSLSSLSSPKQKKSKVAALFHIEHFILAPILSQDGIIGILFVGNNNPAASVTEGDEELIAILTNQISQSLENAQLFEQVYRSRQELESKIQDRTKELARALEEVKKISKAKSEFVSAVSHELRTPLTSIKGYAAILMTGKVGAIPEKVKQRLEKIDKHSDNLVGLINDLLDISRIESGRVEMKFEEQKIAPLIDNICDLLAPQMKNKNIQFIANVPDDLPSLYFDKRQIERVFINLISNAIKFTGHEGQINVTAKPDKNGVLFMVSDTGIGIKDEDLPRLFDEFYRVDNELNQEIKGTGLGLALVKNIIEAHGGKIWPTSQLNKGTTFHFVLPFKKEEEKPQNQ